MQGKKAPRVAREKVTAGGITRTKTEKKKGGGGGTALLALVFGFTFLLFLQFTGMVDLPFLRFLPLGKDKVTAQQETASIAPEGTPEVLYPGPTLVETASPEGEVAKEGEEKEVQEAQEEVVPASQVTVSVTPLPSEAPSVLPSPSPSETRNLTRIARIYSAMEPQDAAKILEQWSDEEVVQVLSAMKERDAARILNAMSVERAASILKKMRERR
ncbi:MAG: hypothetical protein H5U36_08245 [Candidatus Caldatribacterium sp.]|nr:hypothetical protein [Candidatus Caldatribacterium sp.]